MGLSITEGAPLPLFRGVVEAAPAERSVQLVHLVLQGHGRPSRVAHPFGHDVPLGRQGFGFRACSRETGADSTET